MKRFNKSFNRSAASNTDKQNTADRVADMDRELGEQFIADILECKAAGKWNPGFKKFFPRNAITGETFSGRNIISLGYECKRKGLLYRRPMKKSLKKLFDCKILRLRILI